MASVGAGLQPYLAVPGLHQPGPVLVPPVRGKRDPPLHSSSEGASASGYCRPTLGETAIEPVFSAPVEHFFLLGDMFVFSFDHVMFLEFFLSSKKKSVVKGGGAEVM